MIALVVRDGAAPEDARSLARHSLVLLRTGSGRRRQGCVGRNAGAPERIDRQDQRGADGAGSTDRVLILRRQQTSLEFVERRLSWFFSSTEHYNAAVSEIPLRHIDAGRAALARGDWEEAKRAFDAALATEESGEALEGLGLAAWWLDWPTSCSMSRERAYRAYRQRGNEGVGGAHRRLARTGTRRVSRRAGHRQRLAPARSPAARRSAPSPEHAWLARARRVFGAARRWRPRGSRGAGRQRPSAWARRSAHGLRDARTRAARIRARSRPARGRRTAGARRSERGGAGRRVKRLRADRPRVLLPDCRLRSHPRLRARDAVVRSPQGVQQEVGLRPLFAVCRTQYASVCMWRGAWEKRSTKLTAAYDELPPAGPR